MEAPTRPQPAAGAGDGRMAARRVLLVDDHHARRQLMSHLVSLCGTDTSVVGYADDSDDAVAAVERTGANVAIIEMQIPSALDTIATLKFHNPDLRVIVCSFHRDGLSQQAAISRGADAYLTKPLGTRELDPYLAAVTLLSH